jgi:hypothetical protein
MLRKAGVLAHVTASVGWLGAVGAFLAVAIAGMRSVDRETAVAAYVAMDWIAWWAILPSCIASLVTGIVQSLATPWGLLRHYWVIVKLVLTLVATAVLIMHMQAIDHAAEAARQASSIAELGRGRIQLAAQAAAALLTLLIATGLSVYKPRGVTPYGQPQSAAPSEGCSDEA